MRRLFLDLSADPLLDIRFHPANFPVTNIRVLESALAHPLVDSAAGKAGRQVIRQS